MIKQAFLRELADLLEVEAAQLQDSYEFEQNENWDSLTFISLNVMVDEYFKISLGSDTLRNCETVGELLQMIEQKI
jgi:acyl carrier protein